MKNLFIFFLTTILSIPMTGLVGQAIFCNVDASFYNPSILLDEGKGFVQTMDINDQGLIVLAGHINRENGSDIFTLLLNANGSKVNSYGDNGLQVLSLNEGQSQEIQSVLLYENHLIYAGTSGSQGFIIRTDLQGRLDPSFGVNGTIKMDDLNHINVISTYKVPGGYHIIAAGGFQDKNKVERPGIKCLDQNGKTFDNYGQKGMAKLKNKISGFFKHISVSKNGHVIACGTVKKNGFDHEDVIVSKFNPLGELVKTFGCSGGFTIIDAPESGFPNNALSLFVDQTGAITFCGNYFNGWDEDAYLCRLNWRGKPDHSFGTKKDGYYRSTYKDESDGVNTFVVQEDGKIILGGRSDFFGNFDFNLTRINHQGLPDLSFGQNSWKLMDFDEGEDMVKSMKILENGDLLTVGNSTTTNGNSIVVVRHPLKERTNPRTSDMAKF